MHYQAMKAILEFQSQDYSPAALQLIMSKAEEWNTSPAEAVSRLLDHLASIHEKPNFNNSATMDLKR